MFCTWALAAFHAPRGSASTDGMSPSSLPTKPRNMPWVCTTWPRRSRAVQSSHGVRLSHRSAGTAATFSAKASLRRWYRSEISLMSKDLVMPTAPSEQEVISWFDSLSNWGRWGPDDELGTLNLITPDVRKKAAATVTEGVTVSCSWDVPSGPLGFEGAVSAVDLARDSKARIGWSLEHISAMVFHGYAITHLDALCHIFWDGHMYNGRPTDLVSEETGAQQLAITDAGGGMLTRGVLLDGARVRDVPWLEPSEGAFPE